MQNAVIPEQKELIKIVQERIIQKHQCLFLSSDECEIKKQDEVIRQEVRDIIGKEDLAVEDYVLDHLVGYKDLGPYFRDPRVSDIMVNGPDQVYIERDGKVIKTDIKFESNDEVMNILQTAVQRAGRKIDYNNPLVDVRLPDGSRLNAVIAPNCPFTSITIRKFVRRFYTTRELEEQGFLTPEMSTFFEIAVKAGCNIVVAAATGAGKTTFLRTLCDFIPQDDRIVTIEDTYELNLGGHVVPLQKSDRVDIPELMVNSLRMYPKRIILGEFRGAETAELLQALGTGHMGSMTTGHANNGKYDLMQRLVRTMLKTGMTDNEITRQIASAVDLTVFIKKHDDGKRYITEVNELVDDNGRPKFVEIFKYNRSKKKHEALNRLSASLLERIKDELGKDELPQIKAFSEGSKLKEVVGG